MAHDRAFRSNSFGISATIAFAFVMPNSRYLQLEFGLPFELQSLSLKLFEVLL
ncbi:hypothetical protein LEP1GSC035_4269 [Leptospira noguchii str. 2007001578]|uniref:Uncharacterized protein n=1 Tax=Leptospira noguchii str. 2007001578 TaxID=1049974 RepID=A0ABN0J4V7_9LEPT|nr:hypothetical protein LEP1GSC035_4269 [Leptospira noguchii str. 2007001578]